MRSILVCCALPFSFGCAEECGTPDHGDMTEGGDIADDGSGGCAGERDLRGVTGPATCAP